LGRMGPRCARFLPEVRRMRAVSPWCSEKARRVAEHVRRSSVGACRDRRDGATPTVEQEK